MAIDDPLLDRLLVPQPGRKTASHGVPASSAAASDLTPLCAPSAGLGSPNQRPISTAIPVYPAIHRVADETGPEGNVQLMSPDGWLMPRKQA